MAKHIINGTLIITDETWAPIPDRHMDWEAVTDDYEPGAPVGIGSTEQLAIDDLLEQLNGEEPLQRDAYDPDRAYEDARDERTYERLYGYPCMGDE